MAKEVSIVFKATDKLTDSVKSMERSVEGLSRAVKEYKKEQDRAFKNRIRVDIDTTQTRRQLEDLGNAVQREAQAFETASRRKEAAIRALNERYQSLSQTVNSVGQAENNLQRDIAQPNNTNREDTTAGQTGERVEANTKWDKAKKLGKGLATSDIGKMAGEVIVGGIENSVESVFGEKAGATVSGGLSGAATGFAVAGPVGALVGAAVGGLTSFIKKSEEEKKELDSVFTNEVKGIFDLVKAKQDKSLENGRQLLAAEGGEGQAEFKKVSDGASKAWNSVDKAMAEGYNEQRKKGMEKEIEALNGEMGDKLKEANKLIGAHKAELENQYQQSIIDAIDSAQETDEYKKAMMREDGAEMGRILEEAMAKAEVEYRNSEGVAKQKEADLQIVKSIQEDVALNDEYLRFGQKMAEQFTQGYEKSRKQGKKNSTYGPEVGITKDVKLSPMDSTKVPGSTRYATGLDRVPYNDMPALLHEGERILTKVEADKIDKGLKSSTPTFNITVNNNGNTPYEITTEICRQIMRASESFVGGAA